MWMMGKTPLAKATLGGFFHNDTVSSLKARFLVGVANTGIAFCLHFPVQIEAHKMVCIQNVCRGSPSFGARGGNPDGIKPPPPAL